MGAAAMPGAALGVINCGINDRSRIPSRLLVRVETAKAKPVRVSIMIPGDVLAAVDRYAARHGYTRSGLLAQAVRDKLQREND